ncbi:2,3-bisphosphoglycerate-dependent phosphoglycerate mutase [Xylophilus rhododendri]|uniref:2,3-bisphosphoglycerate-dependent phosphoglycerate mutase n=1 Tax=Xylophilus rhododendri TaxID=2697032 RepID=A0A857J6A3_9BURK|nr:2,3-diphosphoglycerate-dependent phosphoglycerate mutase [Xylophilus rhododendri]QHI99520.1 2,3-bisphosphoglycerate-dependent phosphoglycerate mutase [Xylophilus rhododendri]
MPTALSPAELLLIRHGESAWNHEQRFTGWADVGLTAAGVGQMRELGDRLRGEGVSIDRVFSSLLRRCVDSVDVLLDAMQAPAVPRTLDWRLNERHYGALTGRSKPGAVAEFGAEAVRTWRRSYRAVPPPLPLSELAKIAPLASTLSEHPQAGTLPEAESLEQTAWRVAQCWPEVIAPALSPGRRLAVVGHGNSLRALVMQLEELGEAEVSGLEIANGEMRRYAALEDGGWARREIWRPDRHALSQIL